MKNTLFEHYILQESKVEKSKNIVIEQFGSIEKYYKLMNEFFSNDPKFYKIGKGLGYNPVLTEDNTQKIVRPSDKTQPIQTNKPREYSPDEKKEIEADAFAKASMLQYTKAFKDQIKAWSSLPKDEIQAKIDSMNLSPEDKKALETILLKKQSIVTNLSPVRAQWKDAPISKNIKRKPGVKVAQPQKLQTKKVGRWGKKLEDY